MKGGGGEVEKRKDQGEESSSNRDEARSPPRYINFHRSRSLRAFFTITHPFYPRLPILYNSRDVPRNNNFSPSLQNSLSLISRNETSNFFRPLHLLSLSVPAETADKMASRDVSFVLVSPPTFAKSLYEFLRLARPIYRYSRETAKQVPPPILSPFERLPPPIKPRELLFSRPVSTAVVLWPKYRCGLNIFLLSPPHRDFFYISQTFYNRKGYCWKGISLSIDRGTNRYGNHFFSPPLLQRYCKIFSFEIFREDRFIPGLFVRLPRVISNVLALSTERLGRGLGWISWTWFAGNFGWSTAATGNLATSDASCLPVETSQISPSSSSSSVLPLSSSSASDRPLPSTPPFLYRACPRHRHLHLDFFFFFSFFSLQKFSLVLSPPQRLGFSRRKKNLAKRIFFENKKISVAW